VGIFEKYAYSRPKYAFFSSLNGSFNFMVLQNEKYLLSFASKHVYHYIFNSIHYVFIQEHVKICLVSEMNLLLLQMNQL
jgi:hypothetical protein